MYRKLNWKLIALPSACFALKQKYNSLSKESKKVQCQENYSLSNKVFNSNLNFHKLFIRSLYAKQLSDHEIILEADDLYTLSESGETLYQYLKPFENSNNADILWRLARAARDRALKSTNISKEEKKVLVYEAFELSKRALEVDDSNFGSHKWFAITIGDVGDYEGTKAKIANAFLIRDHLEKAIKLNPKDATTIHCLGMWCFVFADMPWYQHKIASVLFTTPPSSTYEEAASFFQKAEEVDPNFYSMNLLMLGKSYAKMGDVRHAMLYLDKAAKYPTKNNEDIEAAMEAKELLAEVITQHKQNK